MVLVVRAHFWTQSLRSFDREALEERLGCLARDHDFHVRLSSIYVHAHRELFGSRGPLDPPTGDLKVEIRLSKHTPLDLDPEPLVDHLESELGKIRGVAPRVRWTTHTEGSVEYLKLLRTIPADQRIPEL